MTDRAWTTIFDYYKINDHNFDVMPFYINATQLREATSQFTKAGDTEPRILCKQDTRESRPQVFKDNGLFILPVKNGEYALIRGEGYVDIPPVTDKTETYTSQLDFELRTSKVGNSESQHLDFAYATSLIRSVMDDDSLVLTIRGRKRTPHFSFRVGAHTLETQSVQTEFDAGYEGRNQVVLLKNVKPFVLNISIESLLFPHLMISSFTSKSIKTVLVEHVLGELGIWVFQITTSYKMSSFQILSSSRWKIVENS